ncbi:MAG TPA: M28 family peptidase [Conexivisphaerales archaeon]|nr:M28 family peptidase [Conexivisphaerales archaeon]
MSADVLQELLKTHVANLSYVRQPDANPAGLDRARDYIWGRMVESGCYMVDQSWSTGKFVFHNVVGEKAAGFNDPPTLILMAHYDTVEKSPGADDNASGVAVMLEASRLIGASGIPVRVFFSAISMKETWQGIALRGSESYLASIRSRGIPVTAAICLDSVGASGQMKQSTPEGLPEPLPPKGDFLAIVGCEGSKPLLDSFSAVCKAAVPSLSTAPLVLAGRGESAPEGLRGDQTTFWARGYPALLLTDTGASRYQNYHAVGDLPDRLNYAFMADVCKAIVAYAASLSDKT